jgi:hypothetical protein
MHRKRHIGVAPVVRHVGRVPAPRNAGAVAKARKPDAGVARVPAPVEATFVAHPDEDEDAVRPVFVDQTGRRRRLIRWAAFIVALLALVLVGLLWFSQTQSLVAPGATPTCPPRPAASTKAGPPTGPSCVAPTTPRR